MLNIIGAMWKHTANSPWETGAIIVVDGCIQGYIQANGMTFHGQVHSVVRVYANGYTTIRGRG